MHADMPASPSEARLVGHRAVPVKTESPEPL
ncbi:UgpA [Brucella ceti B1/94]|nr:UgpA [Brucella ceti B1/94]